MKIGEVARKAGTSVRSIRHYEKVGLIAARRGPNGYREFDLDTVTLVRRIGRMTRLGFSTAEIATFLACIVDDPAKVTVCASVAAAHRKKLAEIEDQIADLEARRDRLLVTLKAASGQDIIQPEPLRDHRPTSLHPPRDTRPRRLLRRHG